MALSAPSLTYTGGSPSPQGPDFVIDEMLHGSREPYTRLAILPEGVSDVAEGDIVVNAIPVLKSGAVPDLTTPVPTGLILNFTDGIGRRTGNMALPIDFTFTTTGPNASLIDQIAQVNAALAADNIALALYASADTFEVLAVYGVWSGTNETIMLGHDVAELSGTLADELGLTGKLLPRRTGYTDPITFNNVRINGSYRSWSKVNFFSDGGGAAFDGSRYLPGAAYPWISFGVVINRPGVPGALDVVVRNAAVIGADVNPPVQGITADPIREYIDPRGLVFV